MDDESLPRCECADGPLLTTTPTSPASAPCSDLRALRPVRLAAVPAPLASLPHMRGVILPKGDHDPGTPQKGGSGKTTVATALAVAHQQDGGRALVADLDPQGSSVAWHHFRDGEPRWSRPFTPPRLDRSLQTFRSRGVSLVLIDTAPHASAAALAA